MDWVHKRASHSANEHVTQNGVPRKGACSRKDGFGRFHDISCSGSGAVPAWTLERPKPQLIILVRGSTPRICIETVVTLLAEPKVNGLSRDLRPRSTHQNDFQESSKNPFLKLCWGGFWPEVMNIRFCPSRGCSAWAQARLDVFAAAAA